MANRWILCAFFALSTGLFITNANAHAVIMSSIPAVKATVAVGDVPVKLRFNSRIDVKRSTITLIDSSDHRRILPIGDESAADTLVSAATGLTPGNYRLRWHVLSVDGHITSGDIPFTVTP